MNHVKTHGAVDRVRAVVRRFAFEQLYSNFAWLYDWVSRTFFLGQWRVWQRASLRFVEGPRVLDVGCGTGSLQFDLRKMGCETWGLDLSPQMLRQALRKARKRSMSLNICRARTQALPFPSGYFNSVISTFPSDYIVHPMSLNEMQRVLAPGGKLIVVPGGWLHPRSPKSRILEGVSAAVYGDDTGGTGTTGGTGASPEAPEGLQQKIERSGWVGLLVSGMERVDLEVSTRLLTNSVGSAFVVVGTKAASSTR